MSRSNRPPARPQSLADFQRQLKEGAARSSEHPLMRETQENFHRFAGALRRPPLRPPQPSAPPREGKRQKGGGRRPALSPDTIVRLRTAYRNGLRRKPKLAAPSLAYKFLRGLLSETERTVSDRTLMRWVIKPVRTK
jgi:hypothetical protein